MGQDGVFLPGVDVQRCVQALETAGGKEIESGKLMSPASSSALAVNAFGWFLDRPRELPTIPGLSDLDWPVTQVAIEREMRFPWSGGRHPWLDAALETERALVGVESKRFEPFRDRKKAYLADAYDRDVWGDGMEPFKQMRNVLRADARKFAFLDAAQLVKHAFGLVSEGRRINKSPVLLYLFAEPMERAGKEIPSTDHLAHREEVDRFSLAVKGSDVRFVACSYLEWLAEWAGPAADHAAALVKEFAP